MADIFGDTNVTIDEDLTPSILPKNISSEAEALILMAPPVQIFDNGDMFYIDESDTNQYKDTLLYKRYIDVYEIGYRHVSGTGGYHPAIVSANPHMPTADYSQDMLKDKIGKEDRSGKIYIPFMRCVVYCEYSYPYYNSSQDEMYKNKIIFDAQGYQNQNMGTLNPKDDKISSSAIGFNKSLPQETIMYTVNVPEKESVDKKAIYCWYYSPKTGLEIQYEPGRVFINDLKVVAF